MGFEVPLGPHMEPLQGKGKKGQGGGRGGGSQAGLHVSLSNGERNVGEKSKCVRGVLFYVICSVFLLNKPHPMSDAKCWGSPGHAPHTHWSGVVTAHQSQTRGGSRHWLSPLWSPGLGLDSRQKSGVSGAVGGNPAQRR